MSRQLYTHHHGPTGQRPRRRLLVTELEHVVRLRRGRIDKQLSPGRRWMRPGIDRVRVFPAGEQVMIVPGQEVLTSDGATVRASLSVVTEVDDAVTLARHGHYEQPLYLQVQLAVRGAISDRTLEQVLDERRQLDEELEATLRGYVDGLGLALRRVAVRDLVVPGELKRAVTEVLTARLAGQATLERARGETAALRSLANAARMAERSPALLPLRLIQQMETGSGNTYVVDTQPIVTQGPPASTTR